MNISFVIPHRFTTGEDAPFLGDNLVRMVKKYVLEDDMGLLETATRYKVVINYRAYKPVNIPLDAKKITKLLKPVFPSGKCVGYETFFVQHNSKTILPVLDFNIYF